MNAENLEDGNGKDWGMMKMPSGERKNPILQPFTSLSVGATDFVHSRCFNFLANSAEFGSHEWKTSCHSMKDLKWFAIFTFVWSCLNPKLCKRTPSTKSSSYDMHMER